MLSISALKKHLDTLFQDPSKDRITVEEAYIAGKRNLEEKVKNRTWLKNTMTRLKQRNLVKPVLAKKTHFKILIGIELTEEGKKLLGSSKVNTNEIFLKEVIITLSKLREETHQNFEVEVKLKEGEVLIRVV